MQKSALKILFFIVPYFPLFGQLKWKDVTQEFGSLPPSIQVFKSDSIFKDSAFIAYYVSVDTKDKALELNNDTTSFRRITPSQFYNRLNNPFILVNTSFFEFINNTNVSLVIKKGKTLAYNSHIIRRNDQNYFILAGALGKQKKGGLNVGYTLAHPNFKAVYFQEEPLNPYTDSLEFFGMKSKLKKWKTDWAVGGGPVLIRNGKIEITNNEELKFEGKAIEDRHPRTAMGYTQEGKFIIIAIQGRMKNAVGATLTDLAEILLNLGCYEGINLDGGGSSCLLVNGKETIVPSDKTGQRPIPAVFYVK